ncbi:MAG: hypothetical protein JF616_09845 [Fibrobacteres bacterium]|jgi:MFS family permease|nr:hypothetical protein [Fibrobacterota bacterium]
MRHKSPFASTLMMCLLAAGLAPSEVAARRVPKSPQAAVLETLGGAAGGALIGAAGSLIVASQFKKNGCEDLQCSTAEGMGIILGGMLGYAVGNPLGIFLTGKAMDPGGSTAGAAVCGFLGQLITIPLVFSANANLALPAMLILPAAAGTFGYYLNADDAELNETSRRLREARAAETLARTGPPGASPVANRFRADLLTFRF